jgi:nitroimidazol reductase NimA-like FMN-containing flavoprotein (pyridoxamine 5'-phosphate oxidase superfamily)
LGTRAQTFERTPRTRVRRRAGRGAYRRATVEAILDEALVAHVGFTGGDGQPYVIPMLHARRGDQLLLHGSPLSRMLGTLREGVPVCVTVTLVDGIVLAKSAFHHSLNYRSVVVLGTARSLDDEAEKRAALDALVEHVAPGRTSEARGPSAKELRATEVLAIPLREASAKIRTGPPADGPEDRDLELWTGEIPLALAAGEPRATSALPLPAYLHGYARGAIGA